MNIFSTVFVALMAILSTAMALYAQRAQMLCHQQAQRFLAMRGRLIALEGAHESLLLQHQKLAGKFHAAQRENSETSENVPSREPPSVGPAPAGLRSPASAFRENVPYCANWQAGQVGGPLSEAARCECDYCNEMRARRAVAKSELMPAARAATLAESRK